MKFDKSKILDYFIENLRNRNLIPKPHLGVLNTKYPEELRGGLFTISDRPASHNVIGYDFIVKGESPYASTTTKFNFWVREGMILSSRESNDNSFVPLELTLKTDLKKMSSILIIKNRRSGEIYLQETMPIEKRGLKNFFKLSWEREFELKYKEFGKEGVLTKPNLIKISVIRNVKEESNGKYRVQVRIINERENDSLRNVGIVGGNNEIYQSIPLGLLLDFEILEECEQAKFDNEAENRWGSFTSIKRLFNLVTQKETSSIINFSEYFRGFETIPRFREGMPKNEFVKEMNKEGNTLNEDVIEAYPHIPNFYKYQEEGIKKIIEELNNKKGIVNIISVRTAGGKTETFAVPILNYCYTNLNKIGTKAIIFYPTKALANDQAQRIFRSLYYLNKILKKRGKRPITMGIYHGDIKKRSNEEKEVWVPFKCPKKECESRLEFKKEGIRHIAKCSKCGEELDYLMLTRYEIHKSTPDILITNQDTLHYTLLNQPQNHSIFGREIQYCETCGTSYISKKVCNCGGALTKISPQNLPEIIVMDEIHMLGGAFGMNTSLFLKRLTQIIRKYSPDGLYNPTFIGATATIKNPEDFASSLFDNKNVNLIPADKKLAYKNQEDIKESSEMIKREHLFILPRSFDSSDTLSYGMSFILKYFAENLEDKPTVLGFCESIKDNRNLIRLTNSRKPKIEGKTFKISGHTSQFEKDLRADIERKFTNKEIDVLYATSTLEVGVDFDDINILLLHGVPSSFNDYLQRVGRSGRKRDAAVITTLRKWSALDYFYLEKCRFMLENPDKFIVDPPFNHKNEIILRNHIFSAFFDYLSSLKNTEKLYSINELKKYIHNEDQTRMSDNFIRDFREYLKNCFGHLLQDEESIIDTALAEIGKMLFVDKEIQNTDDLLNKIDLKFQITKLRTADKEVQIIFQI
jgi:DEAD/DEAH box helicase domain-containing protein